MSAMPITPDPRGSGFVSELGRLRNELRDLAERLDQIEFELRQLLNDILRDRLDGYH